MTVVTRKHIMRWLLSVLTVSSADPQQPNTLQYRKAKGPRLLPLPHIGLRSKSIPARHISGGCILGSWQFGIGIRARPWPLP